MLCSNCELYLFEEETVCKNCGTKVSRSADSSPIGFLGREPQWTCKKCKTEISTKESICWWCGADKYGTRTVDAAGHYTKQPFNTVLGAETIMPGLWGALAGGILGYLLRPSAPFIGQLSFESVITRGANLHGADTLLIPFAETSFNYLIAGVIIGGIVGATAGYFLFRKKGLLNKTEVETFPSYKGGVEPVPVKGEEVAESIKKLAELRDSGILTEEEFQIKKKELLSRL